MKLGLVAVVVILAWAGPVAAQEPTTTVPPPPTTTSTTTTSTTTTTIERQTAKPPKGMTDLTGEQLGRFPDRNYDLGYDEGSSTNITAKVRGGMADFFFGISRSITSIGTWFIGFAYDRGFVKFLVPVADDLSRTYDRSVVGPMKLRTLALTLAVAYAGWLLLRGRSAQGLGELALTLVFAVLGVLFMANPGGYLTGAFEVTGDLTQAVMDVGTDSPDRSYEAGVTHDIRRRLQQTLIAEPHDLLDWGASLDGTPCAEIRDELLAEGPWGTSDEPRERMSSRSECEQYAEWNHDATWDRVSGAFMTMVAALFIMGLVIGITGTVLVAQFTAALIVGAAPFAAVGLLLPGGARFLGWRLVTAFVTALAAVVAVSVLLVFGLKFLASVLESTEGSILTRFAVFLVCAIALMRARKRFARGGRMMAGAAAGRASRSMGAGAGWSTGAAGGQGMAVPGAAYAVGRAEATRRWVQRAPRRHLAHRRHGPSTGGHSSGTGPHKATPTKTGTPTGSTGSGTAKTTGSRPAATSARPKTPAKRS